MDDAHNRRAGPVLKQSLPLTWMRGRLCAVVRQPLGGDDPDAGHHAAVLMLEDVAVEHEVADLVERDFHDHGVGLQAPLRKASMVPSQLSVTAARGRGTFRAVPARPGSGRQDVPARCRPQQPEAGLVDVEVVILIRQVDQLPDLLDCLALYSQRHADRGACRVEHADGLAGRLDFAALFVDLDIAKPEAVLPGCRIAEVDASAMAGGQRRAFRRAAEAQLEIGSIAIDGAWSGCPGWRRR